ncbi:MAG: 50S ribosomal protein L5 [Candidatus Paceibacterota bacterium]|jgi:large subunit ribosomal protein L5
MSKQDLKTKYLEEVVPKMKEKFGYKNDMAVPKIVKVVVNTGVGKLSQQPNFKDKLLPEILKEFSSVIGQSPKMTKAKQSIAGFKTRQGQIVGLAVTLRSKRMYDLLERLTKIALPRVRDFKGLDLRLVDEQGNLNIGLKDYLVWPEVNPEDSNVDFGMEINVVTSARKRDEAVELYRLLGLPFKKS